MAYPYYAYPVPGYGMSESKSGFNVVNNYGHHYHSTPPNSPPPTSSLTSTPPPSGHSPPTALPPAQLSPGVPPTSSGYALDSPRLLPQNGPGNDPDGEQRDCMQQQWQQFLKWQEFQRHLSSSQSSLPTTSVPKCPPQQSSGQVTEQGRDNLGGPSTAPEAVSHIATPTPIPHVATAAAPPPVLEAPIPLAHTLAPTPVPTVQKTSPCPASATSAAKSALNDPCNPATSVPSRIKFQASVAHTSNPAGMPSAVSSASVAPSAPVLAPDTAPVNTSTTTTSAPSRPRSTDNGAASGIVGAPAAPAGPVTRKTPASHRPQSSQQQQSCQQSRQDPDDDARQNQQSFDDTCNQIDRRLLSTQSLLPWSRSNRNASRTGQRSRTQEHGTSLPSTSHNVPSMVDPAPGSDAFDHASGAAGFGAGADAAVVKGLAAHSPPCQTARSHLDAVNHPGSEDLKYNGTAPTTHVAATAAAEGCSLPRQNTIFNAHSNTADRLSGEDDHNGTDTNARRQEQLYPDDDPEGFYCVSPRSPIFTPSSNQAAGDQGSGTRQIPTLMDRQAHSASPTAEDLASELSRAHFQQSAAQAAHTVTNPTLLSRQDEGQTLSYSPTNDVAADHVHSEAPASRIPRTWSHQPPVQQVAQYRESDAYMRPYASRESSRSSSSSHQSNNTYRRNAISRPHIQEKQRSSSNDRDHPHETHRRSPSQLQQLGVEIFQPPDPHAAGPYSKERETYAPTTPYPPNNSSLTGRTDYASHSPPPSSSSTPALPLRGEKRNDLIAPGQPPPP
ncbi:MAG: hypothetical protein Q9216_006762, partial [Gyalolechia sp. 2 TL-2023]